ncbi:hypothetical protein H105_00656 [Trichophyton soudanense CBS 452.61]|uniref:Tat pathway signal sequence n=1 Tax=Trichophyton soudanense CBS 452.61 TaxID=1215331 RepID=A0A022Y5N7_TRISD|nr:hypothetical protein H105_00656 [Trichophyton soudanense CBS 452.61]EZG05732.1 hypothetical protein H106_04748 [Trichophyton rubrum CBS 735.88]
MLTSNGVSDTRLSIDAYENDPFLNKYKGNRIQRRRISILIFSLIFVLGISVFCNIILIFEQYKRWDLDNVCTTYTSQYRSPISNDVNLKYNTVTFNGSLFGDHIWRRWVGDDVDQAWLDLGVEYTPVAIPYEDRALYGLQEGQVKMMEKYGGNFVAHIEVFHHLHCLDVLRKISYYGYEHYLKKGGSLFTNDEKTVKHHAAHCLDILRQQIMCTADTSVFGQWWVKGIGPFVDFNTKHQCKDYEIIRSWGEKHQISPDVEVEMWPGDPELPVVP